MRAIASPENSTRFRAIPHNCAQFKNINFAKQNSDWKPSEIFTIFFILKRVNSVIFFLSVLRKSAIYFKNLNSKLKIYGFNYSLPPPNSPVLIFLLFVHNRNLCLSFFLFVCMSDHNFRTPALTALHLVFFGNYGNILSLVNTSNSKD